MIECPNCHKEIQDINNNIKVESLELKEFKCNHCKNCNSFLFILCKYCQNKIFYEKNKMNQPINGLNGVNLKCPYISCGKYFYITICPKCKKNQKIPKIIKEGEIIKCINDKDCGFEYLQVRCPRKNCEDISYFSRPKNYCNSPNGILYNHKSELIFQKITCHFCFRPIVYTSEKNKINRYYEAQKIICPYKNCKKKFNRISCPICSTINIVETGFYFMGHRIKCIGCRNYFGKILCPKCLKICPLQKNFFQSGDMICRYTSCSQKSNIVNCIHCQKMNIFNNKPPIPGQQIKCAYSDCGKVFNEVYCTSCNELNPFKEGNFIFGKTYKCLYSFCRKIFQFIVCPGCFKYSRTLEHQEGKKFNCNNCEILISNWGCPFCNKTTMDKNSSLEYGQIVRCPGCKNEYSFCRCFDCQKLIFTEESKSILGLSVICKNCHRFSVNVVCNNCKTKISILDRMNDMIIGEKIKCSKCEKDFEYKANNDMIDENNIYFENLSILENIQGEIINFGESGVDDNYLSIEKLFIDSDLYKKENKNNNNNNIKDLKTIIKNDLCILCHCNFKESIFYDCGHKCTCYKCAVYYFHLYKKCPRCDKEAKAIIPKIYE